MTVFEQCKELVDIETAAKYYGVDVKRGGKALCCFHDDTHPSMTFKNGYFRCWACNESGDVVSLVAKLKGVDNFEALKILNKDFNLGLNVKHPSYSIMRQIHKKRRVKDFQKQWLNKRFNQLCSRRKKICSFIKTHKAENLNQAWELARLQGELTRLDYQLDVLTFGNEEEKRLYYESLVKS